MNMIRRVSIAALASRPGVTLVAGTVAVAALDLVTKAAAPVMVPVAPGLLAPMSNDELSIGVAGSSAPVLVAAMAAGLLAAALVAVQLIQRGRAGVVGCLLVLGGALGNLVDRAATGAVHDFLIAGPVVLNVADLAVVAGAASIARALHRTRGTAPGTPAASTQPAPLMGGGEFDDQGTQDPHRSRRDARPRGLPRPGDRPEDSLLTPTANAPSGPGDTRGACWRTYDQAWAR